MFGDGQLMTSGFCALQVIGACAASRFGGKAVLLFAVFLWSVSTSITPLLATSVPALIFCRVLLGLGEGLGKLTVFTTLVFFMNLM
jgi:MFS family permease